jgi:hypothetical protein
MAMEARTLADKPVFGQGEVADRPIAVPKASKTKERAAAKTAPAKTGLHSMKLTTTPGDDVDDTAGAALMSTM